MANNKYNNKVVLSNGQTLIDLSTDTLSDASQIVQGYTAHLRDGSTATGTAYAPVQDVQVDGTSVVSEQGIAKLRPAAIKSVANNLTTASSGQSVLDAYQGRVLNNRINSIKVYRAYIPYVSNLPMTVYNNEIITSSMVCIKAELSDWSVMSGDWTVTTSNGSITISGSIKSTASSISTTSITLYLVNKTDADLFLDPDGEILMPDS